MDSLMIPTWRKPVGILAMLAYIMIWVFIVTSAAQWIETLHVLLQTMFYLICGIIWILPLKPILYWMEHGHWPKKQPKE